MRQKPVIGSNYIHQKTMRSDPTGRHYKIHEEKPLNWKDYFGFVLFTIFCGLLIYFVYNVTEADIEEMKAKHYQMRR